MIIGWSEARNAEFKARNAECGAEVLGEASYKITYQLRESDRSLLTLRFSCIVVSLLQMACRAYSLTYY